MQQPSDKVLQKSLRELTKALTAAEVESPRGWLLAVSGGADSLALWRLATALSAQQGFRVEVAHIDHGLRPSAQIEAAQIWQLAKRLGQSCHVLSLHIAAQGQGLEAAAREPRHLALEELRKLRSLDYVAYAHSADDQAETVLMRLLTGSGIAGLGAMQVLQGRRLRPLLALRRAQLRRLAQGMEMDPVDDVSNRDLALLRPRLRHVIIPPLQEIFGDFTSSLCALADAAQAADKRALEALAGCAMQHPEPAKVTGFRDEINALSPDLRARWLLLALTQVGRRPRRGRDSLLRFARRIKEPGPFVLHFHQAVVEVGRNDVQVLALGPGGARQVAEGKKSS